MKKSLDSLRFTGAGLFFGVAGILALLAGISAYSFLRAAVPAGQVFVVTRDLPPGYVVTANDIGTREMPDQAVPEGARLKREEIIGQRVRFGLAQGDTIRATHLVKDANSEVAQQVSTRGAEYRAVMIPANKVPSHKRLVAGDRLELLGVLPVVDGNKANKVAMPIGVAVVLDTPQTNGTASQDNEGMFLVALRDEEVAKLALTLNAGDLTVAVQGSEPPAGLIPTMRLDTLTAATAPAPTTALTTAQAPPPAQTQKPQ